VLVTLPIYFCLLPSLLLLNNIIFVRTWQYINYGKKRGLYRAPNIFAKSNISAFDNSTLCVWPSRSCKISKPSHFLTALVFTWAPHHYHNYVFLFQIAILGNNRKPNDSKVHKTGGPLKIRLGPL
jgi:hypothetical protein